MSFGDDTDQAGLGGKFPCSALFSVSVASEQVFSELPLGTAALEEEAEAAGVTPGHFALDRMLGDGAFCAWASQREVMVSLGAGALLPVGQQLDLLPEKVRRAGGYSEAASGIFFTEAPLNAVAPTIVVKYAQRLGQCDDLYIDASLSTGGAGRPLSFRWEATHFDVAAGAGGSGAQDLMAALVDATTSNSDTVSFPREKLQPGGKYTINLIATNFFQLTSSLAAQRQLVTISVSAAQLPAVQIFGGRSKETTRSRELVLSAAGSAPSCMADAVIPLEYSWRQVSGPSQVSLVQLPDPRAVRIPAGELLAVGASYSFEVTASISGATEHLSSAAIAEVSVSQQAVVPVIEGGSRTAGVLEPLQVSAGRSFDPDISPSVSGVSGIPAGASHQYWFEWSCRVRSTGKSCSELLPAGEFAGLSTIDAFSVSPVLLGEYQGQDLEVGVNVSSVLLFDSSQTWKWAYTSATYTILAGAVPRVTVSQPAGTLLVPSASGTAFKVDVSTRLVLSGAASFSDSALGSQFVFQWNVEAGDVGGTTAGDLFSTPLDQARVALRAGALTPGAAYTLRLDATSAEHPQLGGSTRVFLLANRAPSAGFLESARSTGKALKDTFRFRALRWVDDPEDMPLRYSFWVDPSGGIPSQEELLARAVGTPLGAKSQDNSIATVLPISTHPQSLVTVVLYVEDSLGSTASSFVRVTASQPLEDGEDPEFAAVSFVSDQVGSATQALAEGNGAKSMAAVSSLAGLLGSASSRQTRRSLGGTTAPRFLSGDRNPYVAVVRRHIPFLEFEGLEGLEGSEELTPTVRRQLEDEGGPDPISERAELRERLGRAVQAGLELVVVDDTMRAVALSGLAQVTARPEEVSPSLLNVSHSIVRSLLVSADGQDQVTSSLPIASSMLQVASQLIDADSAVETSRLLQAKRLLRSWVGQHSKGRPSKRAVEDAELALEAEFSSRSCSSDTLRQLASLVHEIAASMTAGALANEGPLMVSSISDSSSIACPSSNFGGVAVQGQVVSLRQGARSGGVLLVPGSGIAPEAVEACHVGDLSDMMTRPVNTQRAAFEFDSGFVDSYDGTENSVALLFAEFRSRPFCTALPDPGDPFVARENGTLSAAAQPLSSFVTDVTLVRGSSEGESSSQSLHLPPSRSGLAYIHLPLVGLKRDMLELPLVHYADSARRRGTSCTKDTLMSEEARLSVPLCPEVGARGAFGELSERQASILDTLTSGDLEARLLSSSSPPAGVHSILRSKDLGELAAQHVVTCPDNASEAWWAGGSEGAAWLDPYRSGSAILEVACPLGTVNVTCTEDMARGNVSVTCPAAAITAACAWFDPGNSSWETEGCVAYAVNATHLSCACDHLTAFSSRFARIGSGLKTTFSGATARQRREPSPDDDDEVQGNSTSTEGGEDNGPVGGGRGSDSAFLADQTYVVVLLSALAVAFVGLLALGIVLDGFQHKHFLAALAEDEEVTMVRNMERVTLRSRGLQHKADGWNLGNERVDQREHYDWARQTCIPCIELRGTRMGDRVAAPTEENTLTGLDQLVAASLGGITSSVSRLSSLGSNVSRTGEHDLYLARKDCVHPERSDGVLTEDRAVRKEGQQQLANRSASLFWRAGLLRLVFQHPILSLCFRFDPRLSRPKRLTVLFTSLVAALAAAAFVFDAAGVVEGQEPVWYELLLLGLISSAVQIPFSLLVSWCLSFAASAEFANAHPALAAEIAARKSFEEEARQQPHFAREVSDEHLYFPSRSRSVYASVQGISQGAASATSGWEREFDDSQSLQSTSPNPEGEKEVHLVHQLRLDVDACGGRVSIPLSHCAAPAPAPDSILHPNDSDVDTEDELLYGWFDAPLCCLENFTVCVQACSRHPSQRAEWVRVSREADFDPWGCCWTGSAARVAPPAPGSIEEAVILDKVGPDTAQRMRARWALRREEIRSSSRACCRVDPEHAVAFPSLSALIARSLQKLAVKAWCRRYPLVGHAVQEAEAHSIEGIDRQASPVAVSTTSASSTSTLAHQWQPDQEGSMRYVCQCCTLLPPIALRQLASAHCCVYIDGPGRPISWLLGWETPLAWLGVICAHALMLSFILLFGLSRGPGVLLSYVQTFCTTQAVVFLLIHPALILLSMLWSLVLRPSVSPAVAWLPGCGVYCLGLGGRQGPHSRGLSARMEHLTLLRASGRATGLQSHEALVALGSTPVLHAGREGGTVAWLRRQVARAFYAMQRHMHGRAPGSKDIRAQSHSSEHGEVPAVGNDGGSPQAGQTPHRLLSTSVRATSSSGEEVVFAASDLDAEGHQFDTAAAEDESDDLQVASRTQGGGEAANQSVAGSRMMLDGRAGALRLAAPSSQQPHGNFGAGPAEHFVPGPRKAGAAPQGPPTTTVKDFLKGKVHAPPITAEVLLQQRCARHYLRERYGKDILKLLAPHASLPEQAASSRPASGVRAHSRAWSVLLRAARSGALRRALTHSSPRAGATASAPEEEGPLLSTPPSAVVVDGAEPGMSAPQSSRRTLSSTVEESPAVAKRGGGPPRIFLAHDSGGASVRVSIVDSTAAHGSTSRSVSAPRPFRHQRGGRLDRTSIAIDIQSARPVRRPAARRSVTIAPPPAVAAHAVVTAMGGGLLATLRALGVPDAAEGVIGQPQEVPPQHRRAGSSQPQLAANPDQIARVTSMPPPAPAAAAPCTGLPETGPAPEPHLSEAAEVPPSVRHGRQLGAQLSLTQEVQPSSPRGVVEVPVPSPVAAAAVTAPARRGDMSMPASVQVQAAEVHLPRTGTVQALDLAGLGLLSSTGRGRGRVALLAPVPAPPAHPTTTLATRGPGPAALPQRGGEVPTARGSGVRFMPGAQAGREVPPVMRVAWLPLPDAPGAAPSEAPAERGAAPGTDLDGPVESASLGRLAQSSAASLPPLSLTLYTPRAGKVHVLVPAPPAQASAVTTPAQRGPGPGPVPVHFRVEATEAAAFGRGIAYAGVSMRRSVVSAADPRLANLAPVGPGGTGPWQEGPQRGGAPHEAVSEACEVSPACRAATAAGASPAGARESGTCYEVQHTRIHITLAPLAPHPRERTWEDVAGRGGGPGQLLLRGPDTAPTVSRPTSTLRRVQALAVAPAPVQVPGAGQPSALAGSSAPAVHSGPPSASLSAAALAAASAPAQLVRVQAPASRLGAEFRDGRVIALHNDRAAAGVVAVGDSLVAVDGLVRGDAAQVMGEGAQPPAGSQVSVEQLQAALRAAACREDEVECVVHFWHGGD